MPFRIAGSPATLKDRMFKSPVVAAAVADDKSAVTLKRRPSMVMMQWNAWLSSQMFSSEQEHLALYAPHYGEMPGSQACVAEAMFPWP